MEEHDLLGAMAEDAIPDAVNEEGALVDLADAEGTDKVLCYQGEGLALSTD